MEARSLTAEALASALAEAVGPDRLLPARDYPIDGRTPLVAVRPRSVEEVSAVLATASRLGASVAPWGGGTRMGLGLPPARYHIALDLRALDGVVDHQPADLTATVQAGTTVASVQRALGSAGQFLPLDPPLPGRATVGGTLAVGTAGPLQTAFGLPRERVIGIRVVHPDGTVTKSGGRVVKNVTGFALEKVYVGSLGTLAVIVEATFKIAPQPREERTVLAVFPSAEKAVASALDLAHRALGCLAVEVLTERAWDALKVPFAPLPAEGRHYWLLVRCGGRPLAVERQEREVREVLSRHGPQGVEVLKREEGGALWRGVADFGWEEPSPPLGVRLVLLPSEGAWGLALLEEALLEEGPAVALHATTGVLRAFWRGPLGSPEGVARLVSRLREEAGRRGGTLVVERAPQEVKARCDVWGEPGPPLALMRSFKETYDPRGILNPGRFVGGI